MDKTGLPRSFRIYFSLAVLFVALVLMMPKTGKFNYDYKKGSPWMYETLVAEFDFPILKTEAQLVEERRVAGSEVIPYYRVSEGVAEDALNAIEAASLGVYDSLKAGIKETVAEIYSKGVISGLEKSEESSAVIYIQRNMRAYKSPISEVYDIDGARAAMVSAIRRLDISCNADSLCRSGGIYEALVPNLLFDSQTTDLVHDETVNYISPTSGVVYAGQVIVTNGEIVTAEVEQLLDSYKAEYESSLGYSGPVFFLWAGDVIIALALVFILFFSVFYSNPSIFSEFNRFLYLLVIFFLSSLVTFAVEKTGHANIYLVPYALIALYLISFFKRKVVYPVYVLCLLPLLIFSNDGPELFVMYLVAGVVAIYSFSRFSKGWQQFVTAFFVYIFLAVTFLGFRLVEGMDSFSEYRPLLYLALGSLFMVAGYPLIYLFERMFMFVSTSRLIELSDTNNKLLQDLAHKAPGTFQHSLQVMNMVDAVARQLDANVELVRCGALYHDIGKMQNPLCFIENETPGTKYHEGLSPLESARDILRHVTDGVALADKAKLPSVVKDFIITHHGTTCAAYFYSKFMEQGGNPDEAGSFYYKGKKPQTKEQSILMICDTIEAASRTLKDFSKESISAFVERIVDGKIADGQFENADISMRELHTLKGVLKDYLQQVHHARVVYPNRPAGERKRG